MNLKSTNHGLCQCCSTIASYVESHLDPYGSLLANPVSDSDVDELIKMMGCTEDQADALREYVSQRCERATTKGA